VALFGELLSWWKTMNSMGHVIQPLILNFEPLEYGVMKAVIIFE
jgi:hypothetical protein